MVTKTQDEVVMPKRVMVYTDDLKQYLIAINEKLNDHSKKVKEFATALVPPYPVITLSAAEDNYHLPDLALIINSCMMQLYDELDQENHTEIERCLEIYQNLPSKDPDKRADAIQSEDTTIDDAMLDLSHNIAEYLIDNDIKVRNLRRLGVTSDKITCALAIIYVGRKLIKLAQLEATDEPANP